MDYETLKSGLGEYIRKVEHQRSKYVKTLTGEYLRSTQEVQIANFLYLNNIDYEYEKIYPFTITGSKKKYTPDFFIKQGENECYIEHFGITEALKSNRYTPEQLAKYKKSIIDKRKLHKDFKTNLIETWSYYNDNRSLMEHLREELQRKGFIEQFKTSGYDADGFSVLRSKTDNVRTLLFLDIAGSFVQKNSTQIRTQLVSPKHLTDPIILEMYNDSYEMQKNLAEAITNAISRILEEFGHKSSILMIGRYNYDLYKLLRTEAFTDLTNNVALTRTKNRVYIAAPLHRPSRFLIKLIKDYKLPHPKEMNTDVVDMFKLRCPICNYPLKQEYNKNYGLRLHICTNDPEVCDFMTNDQKVRKDIFKCPKCKDGYMIVKKSKTSEERFDGKKKQAMMKLI